MFFIVLECALKKSTCRHHKLSPRFTEEHTAVTALCPRGAFSSLCLFVYGFLLGNAHEKELTLDVLVYLVLLCLHQEKSIVITKRNALMEWETCNGFYSEWTSSSSPLLPLYPHTSQRYITEERGYEFFSIANKKYKDGWEHGQNCSFCV